MKRCLLVLLLCMSLSSLMAIDTDMVVLVGDFCITVPQWWTVMRPGDPNLLMATAPAPADAFQRNVTVFTETVPDGTTSSSYLDNAKKILVEIFDDFEIIECDTFCNIYRARINDGQQIIQMQCVYIRNNTAYTVTCTASAAEFDNAKSDFVSIINSVRFID